jgi:type VI secretion system secreted protein VgrG
MGAEGSLTLVAKKGITIQCGDSVLSLTPEGLKIGAKALALAGADGLRLKGKGPALELGEEAEIVAKAVKIFSKGASLELSEDAHLRGGKVLLNCDTAEPPEEDAESGKKKTKPLKVKLSDVALAATAGKKYRLLVDGNLYEGTTGASGEVEQEIPEAAMSATLTVWTEDYPEGPRQQWNLRLKELAPAGSAAGAALRLRNLGYYSGTVGDDMKDLPDPAVAALKEFQKDHGLEASGKLDGAAVAKLTQVYGH